MRTLHLGKSPESFIWASGIEDTFVPQIRKGHRSLDEYDLMGHYEHWREDLALGKELGISAVRWGVPWYKVEPKRGTFDWSWTDKVLPYIVEELGIVPILDLMHYGCPFWLEREFANDEYPDAVAAYAKAFVERYKSLIQWYTPLNEPLVNSLMCGKRGLWPPYLRGDSGYIKVMVQLAKGIVRTVEAIKTIDPNAKMLHVEATGLTRAIREDLEALAVEDQHRGYLCYDLITGQVRKNHPLFPWLIRNSANMSDLMSLTDHPISLDVIGLNFYPQWSTQQLYIDGRGRLAYRATEQDGSGFGIMIEDFYKRYKAPVVITETSAFGSEELRSKWLQASVGSIKSLRQKGIPVLGYTWFPMFTMVDWRYRFGRHPIEHYYIQLGLYKLASAPESSEENIPEGVLPHPLQMNEYVEHSMVAASEEASTKKEEAPRPTTKRWENTPLVEQFQSYVNDPLSAIGELNESDAIHGVMDGKASEQDVQNPQTHERSETGVQE